MSQVIFKIIIVEVNESEVLCMMISHW